MPWDVVAEGIFWKEGRSWQPFNVKCQTANPSSGCCGHGTKGGGGTTALRSRGGGCWELTVPPAFCG